jgi:hypothetical protein
MGWINAVRGPGRHGQAAARADGTEKGLCLSSEGRECVSLSDAAAGVVASSRRRGPYAHQHDDWLLF